MKSFGYGKGNDARIVPFDSPFVLRFSKDGRRLRTGLGYVFPLKKSRNRWTLNETGFVTVTFT